MARARIDREGQTVGRARRRAFGGSWVHDYRCARCRAVAFGDYDNAIELEERYPDQLDCPFENRVPAVVSEPIDKPAAKAGQVDLFDGPAVDYRVKSLS